MPENDPNAQDLQGQAPQGAQAPANPYDTSGEVSELQALQEELNQSEESIEGNAAQAIAKQLTEADDELYFEDKEAFVKRIFALQNAWIKENIAPKQARAQELIGSIESKNQMGQVEAGAQAFLANHPELTPDIIPVIIQFVAEELPPRMAKELHSISDPLEFFETAYAIYSQATGHAQGGEQTPQEPQAQEGEELPAQLQGVNREADFSNSRQPLPMERE